MKTHAGIRTSALFITFEPRNDTLYICVCMGAPFFKFKRFTVWHDRCSMKVGTDGVLLGAWADVAGAADILDVGTGSGVVALMLAQRNETAHVCGVELDADAARQAAENAAASPWAERVEIVRTDFTAYAPEHTFRHIVSNPPYYGDSLCNPDPRKSMARHLGTLSYESLFAHSARLLDAGGQLSLIFPSEAEPAVSDAAWRHHFFPLRQTRVFTKSDKPCRRILLTLHYNPTPDAYDTACHCDELVLLDSQGNRSADYVRLTQDFYL